jgi:Zn-dependent M28 family amino/carboxypeptidase
VDPVATPARNVIGMIPGSDPKLRGEYVAIGAHNDHVGFNNQPVDHDSMRIFTHIVRVQGAEDNNKPATPEQQVQVNSELAAWRAAHPGTARKDSIFNGADDDGSGSVSVLEIAEKVAAMNPKPKRSILFVWHVGEEKGMWGSQWFVDHPTVPRDSVVAQLNIDMVGRGDAWDVTGTTKAGDFIHGNPDYLQLIGSRRLSTELGNLMETVNTEDKHNLKFDYALDANGHPLDIYCRSDHMQYARYGIPIVFFTTGGHSDYHQLADEPEYIDYEHMARVDNFIWDALMHVANLDHRVVVDHPKPDPNHWQCQQ